MGNEVSVIIPVRNRHHLLLRAICSVQAQVDVECELIIVDDASEPAVGEFLEASNIKNVKVLRNAVRRNAAFCRNRGARVARFPYLAFLDSDDLWFPLHLKNALATLQCSGMDTLYVARFGPDQEVFSCRSSEHSDAYELIFDRVGDPRSSALVCQRTFFEKVGGFDDTLEKYQDWDFALRCAQRGKILLGCSKTAYLDTNAVGRMSSSLNIDAARRFLATHGAQMSEAHRVRFFVTLLRVAASAGKARRQAAVALFSEYLPLRSFPIKYWPLRFTPTTGRLILGVWLYVRRFRGSKKGSSVGI